MMLSQLMALEANYSKGSHIPPWEKSKDFVWGNPLMEWLDGKLSFPLKLWRG